MRVYVYECVLCVCLSESWVQKGSKFYIPQRCEYNPTPTSGVTRDLRAMGMVSLDLLSATCSQEGSHFCVLFNLLAVLTPHYGQGPCWLHQSGAQSRVRGGLGLGQAARRLSGDISV